MTIVWEKCLCGWDFFFFFCFLGFVVEVKTIREKTKDKESVVWKDEEG